MNWISIADLVQLRKLRKLREGIDITKLNKGDVNKKRKKAPEEDLEYGLKAGFAAVKQPTEVE